MICKWDNEHKRICFQQVRSDCMYYYIIQAIQEPRYITSEMHDKANVMHETWAVDPIKGHVYVKSLQEKYSGIASGVKPQHLHTESSSPQIS